MSVRGLVEAERQAATIERNLNTSFNKQLRELKQEIQKVEYLLGDKEQATRWANSLADPARTQRLRGLLDETERLYLEAGDSTAARIFKQRMERQLRTRLTNLKANELEVQLRAAAHRVRTERVMTERLTNIRREGAARELYNQSRGAGGFLSGTGRGFMKDLVTLETKAAGSKTINEYMDNLYKTYEKGLKDVFVKGIVRGDSYQQMERNLMRATDITKGKAKLLVRTEANAIFNESVRDVIDSNPLVKGYRFRSVLDRKTSSQCQKMDGKYIPKEDVVPGKNFPPLHPNCRSTVTTVLVTENEKKDQVQRFTKNKQNEWVKVPPGMTYPEFKRRIAEFENATLTPRGVRNAQLYRREAVIAPNDYRITNVGTSKIVQNVPASAALLDNKLGASLSPGAQAVYDNVLKQEAKITTSMIRLADAEGVRLSGIEYSAKTASSVTEKVARVRKKMSAGVAEMSDEQIIDNMPDLVRYTVVSDHDKMVKTTEGFMEGFSKRGYKVMELDNKYLDGDGTYKGIHLGVVAEDGRRFEVQVHSETSLKVKSKNHTLYEEARKVTTPIERVIELNNEMIDTVQSMPVPKDINKLKSFRRDKK